MALDVQKLTFIGTFASDALANTEVTNQGFLKRVGLIYWNTVIKVLRYWDGSAWKTLSEGIMAKMYRTSDQNLNDGGWTILQFNTTEYDTGSLVGTNRFDIPAGGGGVYLCASVHSFDPHATGERQAMHRKNATLTLGGQRVQAETSGPGYTIIEVVTHHKFTAGDYVDFQSYQNSGGLLPTSGSQSYQWAAIYRLGDG